MNTHTTHPAVAPAAVLAGTFAGASGILQLFDEPSGESTVVGAAEHLILVGLAGYLVALVPVVLLLARAAGRPRRAAVALTGMLGLAALTTVSNIRGEDPSFFAAVAAPTNLLWFGGFVSIAVALRKSGSVPRLVWMGLPVAWIAMLPLSQFGGGLVACAYWLMVGWLLQNGELTRATARPALA